MRFKRPDFFREKGESKKYPKFIEFTPKAPAMFSHLPTNEVIAYFEKRIADEETRIRKERKDAKKTFMGMTKCFEQSPFSTPKTSRPMTTINPRFSATIIKNIRLAVEGMKAFWRAYKKRLDGFRKGSKARFPAGTIQIAHRYSVKCADLGRGDPHSPAYAPFAFPWRDIRKLTYYLI